MIYCKLITRCKSEEPRFKPVIQQLICSSTRRMLAYASPDLAVEIYQSALPANLPQTVYLFYIPV